MDQNINKTIEEYIDKAPEVIKKMLADCIWAKNANLIAQKFKLDFQKTENFKNEIIFVLIGMEPRKDFVENIKNELSLDQNIAGWIAEDVEREIFSEVVDELDNIEKQMSEENIGQETIEPNPIGQSFEKIILNQAKAMQPAKPAAAPTGGRMNYEVRSMEKKKEEQPKIVHDYARGNDPYREPLQ